MCVHMKCVQRLFSFTSYKCYKLSCDTKPEKDFSKLRYETTHIYTSWIVTVIYFALLQDAILHCGAPNKTIQ